MKVLKFGGSSVGTPDRIKGVKKIIDAVKGPCVVIVSAFEGVTDSLKKISELAVVRNEEYKTLLEESLIMHKSFADELAGEADKAEVLSVVDLIFFRAEIHPRRCFPPPGSKQACSRSDSKYRGKTVFTDYSKPPGTCQVD